MAILFAAATVLYSGLWMYCIRAQPRAVMGIQFEDLHGADSLRVTQVVESSGAKLAGLQPGDIVRAIDGWTVVAYTPFPETVTRGWPGDVIRLTIERPGESAPRVLPVILGPPPAGRGGRTSAQAIATQAIGSFPVVFLVVGFFVLFMRLQDRNAWLLALLFASVIAVAPMLNLEGVIPRSLRGFAIAYKIIFNGLFGAFAYCFCAVFPVPSPIDRRVPWLKSWLLAAAAAVVVPLGIAAWWAGGGAPLFRFSDRIGPTAAAAFPSIYFFGATALALASLVWNGLRAPAAEARRRTRVIVWGTVAGVLPFMTLNAAAVLTQRDPYSFPFWAWAPSVLAVLLLPLSFAYAIIKHRVLEIQLLLKRGARYVLVQRGFTLLLIVAGFALTVLFARWSSEFLRTRLDLGAAAGTLLGAGFGIALVWTGTWLRTRVAERIDRAFFHGAYDARQIMQALAEKTSAATTREELGAFLAGHIRQALHPSTLAIYLEDGRGSLVAVHGASPAVPERIPPAGSSMDRVTDAGRRVPLFGRDGRQAGVILLGERLSEEPYSKEDRLLLTSVASQAALALENFRLAGQIAERLEAERRVTLELELAKEVQSRLLPRRVPRLQTLDCAGHCLQARAVGGDYYDFLELGGGGVGLVLADIAGKGIAGALMMATLQANLRSQSGLAREDQRGMLCRLNQSMRESIAEHRYATLFFGCYEDTTRHLRYTNCGHNPPILLRMDGSVERLAATATILGAFEVWDCSVAETILAPGDALLLYSDGITEARNVHDDEFGEARLLETMRRHRHAGAPALVAAILQAVRESSVGEQADDITLVAARCR